MSKRYIYMLFIFLIFIISTSIFSSNYFKIEQVKNVYSSSDLKCKYTVSNIIEEKDNYKILVYYPVTENKELNKNIMDKINIYIDKFRNGLNGNSNDLTIQFNSNENDIYTSFIFNVTISNDTSHKIEYVFSCNYNNDENKIVTINDILSMRNNSLNDIANSIYESLKEKDGLKEYISDEKLKEYLDLNKEKYECFYFAKDSIIFCFNVDTIAPKSVGIIYVPVSYDKIIEKSS